MGTVWVWKTPAGTLLWGETRDFMDWLTAAARVHIDQANAMLDSAQRANRQDVPPESQRYTAKEA